MSTAQLLDFRFAIRRLRKDAGTTIAAVAALAFAIGAAVATWSLLSAVLLKPLPVLDSERLFQVGVSPPPNVATQWVPTKGYPTFESVRDSGAFDNVAGGGLQSLLVIEHGDVPQSRQVYFATENFFATLGISAVRGRTFTADEDRRGAPAVAVLADHYWRRVFDSDPNVLGRAVTVSGTTATIIGILPRGFRGLYLSEAPDLYLPLQISADIDHEIFNRFGPLGPRMPWIRIVGRLRPGETSAAAAVRINALDCLCPRQLPFGEVDPFVLTEVNTAAVPQLTRAATAQFAALLSITVGLLLLVGCLTVGMLLLVRTEDRRDELAVRLALGATRTRLALGIAVEAAILCAAGAVLAVPVALWLFYGVRAFRVSGSIDIERLELTLDPAAWLAVTGAALAASCVIALLASLVGLLTAARAPVQSRGLATPRVTRRTPRTVLVAGQVAITLVLVTGAALFGRSVVAALSLNPTIATDRIVTAYVNLEQHGYTPASAGPVLDELIERLRQSGLVESVSAMRFIGGAGSGAQLQVDGLPRELPSSGLGHAAVDDNFFATLGLPIVSGRNVARSDTSSAPPVAVVSESLARFIADGGDPLGHRIAGFSGVGIRGGPPGMPAYVEVVGVVPDLVTEVNDVEPLMVYQPNAQWPPSAATSIYLRAARDPGAAVREAMAAARALDARVTLQSMRTLDEQMVQQMQPQRFGIYVLGTLGGIALLLTVLGTYVIAQSMVVRRRRELGIRAALGARSAQLRRLVLRDTTRLVGVGLIAGLALAVAGARLIRSLLYQVEPLDPVVLAMVAASIFGLALLVSLRPALLATRVDLNRVLREE
jgi:putative ABC transport system permease protein